MLAKCLSFIAAFVMLISNTAFSEEIHEEQSNDWMEQFLEEHHNTEQTGTLTIINCESIVDFRMTNAIQQFEKETGMHVLLKEIGQTQLITQLLSMESSIDILFTDSSNLNELQEAGVLLSLSTFHNLENALETWMKVFEPGKVGNELYSLPAFLSVAKIYIHKELLPYLSGEISDQYTWSELLNVGNTFQPKRDGQKRPQACFLSDNLYYPEFFRQYLSAYAGNDISFSDDELRRTLEIYKKLVQEDLIKDSFDTDDTRGALLQIGRMIELETEEYIPMPLLGDGRSYVVGYLHGLSVNAFSTHKKEAERFLELYASEENQAYPEGYGFLDNIDLNYDASFLSPAERDRLLLSKDYYEKAMPLWQKDDFVTFLREEMMRYLNSEISLDVLIDELNRKIQMVING